MDKNIERFMNEEPCCNVYNIGKILSSFQQGGYYSDEVNMVLRVKKEKPDMYDYVIDKFWNRRICVIKEHIDVLRTYDMYGYDYTKNKYEALIKGIGY